MKLTRENFASHTEFLLYETGFEHGSNNHDYEEFVMSIFKTFPSPIETLLHAGVGISGEAGEILDALKKTWVYTKPLDVDNLKEELGDILFYVTALATNIGTTLPELMQGNIEKLRRRYPEGYTDAAAQRRADKIGGEK